MQNIVIEKPYKFRPPHRGNWWPNFIQAFELYWPYLRRTGGIVSCEVRDEQRLATSLEAGHGIMLTPNHARAGDPIIIGQLAKKVNTHVFAMASWHLFNQDWFTSFAIHKMGAFSVNREGVDRQAINTAIEILETGERPLVVFPEGAVSRTNDRLQAMLDGVAFIARTAAKRRKKRGDTRKVVIHPVAIKYLFQGDLENAVDDVLSDIEHRLSWQPQEHVSLLNRITKVGRALLCLKELEYFGREQGGTFVVRLEGLINRLLGPLEEEWLGERQTDAVVPRVKNLRMKILPEMVQGTIDEPERQRRWKQLAAIYLAQQVSCYPPDYLSTPTVDRLLETIERFEEDLTDKARVHGSLHAVMQVGEAIEVSPQRDRTAETDPIMDRLDHDLQAMLDGLAQESPVYQDESA
ncbi:MAG: 1-acyl-sn-glycerol-3-phosphate acyltransferase [Pirellulaceae bacterium]|jgi:1-acyl-sn-glycerol-3-phosphate acyltransferase|nr:1-acyl-sn-glycerol-3-phosphate acyltransferase [Pirellulaceae bacterium]MDP6716999.1 1-acyl-sn-glycerol-3-phosphate acyltransferase [Pirellulaceae bacterium]